MATQHATVTPTTTGLNLSTVITQKGLLRYLALTPDAGNTGVVYIGDGSSTLSTTTYGQRLEIPVSSIPQAPTIFESSEGLISLADVRLLAATTTQKVHVFMITA